MELFFKAQSEKGHVRANKRKEYCNTTFWKWFYGLLNAAQLLGYTYDDTSYTNTKCFLLERAKVTSKRNRSTHQDKGLQTLGGTFGVKEFKIVVRFFIGQDKLRNSAMCTGCAKFLLRGGSMRKMEFSDITCKTYAKGEASELQDLDCLVVVSDNGKVNDGEKYDFWGCFRDRDPLICFWANLSLWFLEYLELNRVGYNIVFDDARTWYDYKVAPGADYRRVKTEAKEADADCTKGDSDAPKKGSSPELIDDQPNCKPISPSAHYSFVMECFKATGLDNKIVGKITHVFRGLACVLRDMGASYDGIKALGKWKLNNGACENHYMNVELPMDAMVANSGHRAERFRSVYINRVDESLEECPQALRDAADKLFPWADAVHAKHQAGCTDPSALAFTKLVIRFRHTILEDAPFFYVVNPNMRIFTSLPIFQMPEWREWVSIQINATKQRSIDMSAFQGQVPHAWSNLLDVAVGRLIDHEQRWFKVLEKGQKEILRTLHGGMSFRGVNNDHSTRFSNREDTYDTPPATQFANANPDTKNSALDAWNMPCKVGLSGLSIRFKT